LCSQGFYQGKTEKLSMPRLPGGVGRKHAVGARHQRKQLDAEIPDAYQRH
jgi:hypothetical protein